MTATVLPFQEIKAPEHWRTVEFISDLHLQEKDSATFAIWQSYMQETTADAVFILGDLFEVWVGDDAVHKHPFLEQCRSVLAASAAKRFVAFMRGNRDFLVGSAFLNACQVHDLNDPAVLHFGTQRVLLTHGDEACIDDVDYQSFRRMVRSDDWQKNFLAKPLAEREDIARHLRNQSESHKRDAHAVHADVDATWAIHMLEKSNCISLIHGHTHKPADHWMGLSPQWVRRVLSDWDAQSAKPRAEVLRWSASGQVQRINLSPR
jgi:UDP-2,3-diacylglucosamine hydrolase